MIHKERLILLFDGTWNDPENQTNVYRLAKLIKNHDDDNVRQRFFYNPGVGEKWWQKIRGGLFGYGLSQILREGYQWLSKRYTEDCEIWIFGFSRGAYTARSLAGLLRKCGLLHIYTQKLLKQAEVIYRNKELHPDCNECREFRANFSREVKVHFIGVWDTVGRLGVPGTVWTERDKLSWHDTELSSIVKHAFHAVALDEYRALYDVALWTGQGGKQKDANEEVEQRWFVGAHADVGGGYGPANKLADLSMAWMLKKAAQYGLKCRGFSVVDGAWQQEPTDSYGKFLLGLYAMYRNLIHRGDGRYYRTWISRDAEK